MSDIPQSKFLILLPYFNRPNLVHNALGSIRDLQYDNFIVAGIDDGSTIPLSEIVEMHYYDLKDRIKLYRINDTVQSKIDQGGSQVGRYLNRAIAESGADLILVLCDDDTLVPDVLTKANCWFNKDRDHSTLCGFYHTIDYNPITQRPEMDLPVVGLHNYDVAVNGLCSLDIGQMVWRIEACKKYGILFNYPQTAYLESHFFQRLFDVGGRAKFMGFVGQFKAMFPGMLSHRPDPYHNAEMREPILNWSIK